MDFRVVSGQFGKLPRRLVVMRRVALTLAFLAIAAIGVLILVVVFSARDA